MEYFFGWGIVHDVGIQGFFGVVDRGHRIARCIVEEALQVGVVDNLDRVLEKPVDKNRTKTRGGGERGDMREPIYIQKHSYTQPKTLSQRSLLYFA